MRGNSSYDNHVVMCDGAQVGEALVPDILCNNRRENPNSGGNTVGFRRGKNRLRSHDVLHN